MTFKSDKTRKRGRGMGLTISGPDSPPAAKPKDEDLKRGRIRRRIEEIESRQLIEVEEGLYAEVWD